MYRKLILFVLALSMIAANAAFAGKVVEIGITNTNDSVEDQLERGMYMGSSDLEFPNDGGLQVIGLRFLDVEVPQGASILEAYIVFTVDETEADDPANLIIEGELIADAPEFEAVDNNVNDRARTAAQVKWSPEHYPTVGAKVQTEDIASVIKEMVSQEGWATGNALAIIISDDPDNPSTGLRTVESGSGDLAALLHIEYSSKFAILPEPPNGSMYLDTWASLGWEPGETATSSDIYFSDNLADVEASAEAAFQGNQVPAFFVVGFPGMPFPEGLVPGTTYYWRIDSIEADGTTKYEGPVWSFIIPSRTAYDLNPPDGAQFMGPDTVLKWQPGFDAKLHTVYFGDNFDDVNNASGGIPQTFTEYTPSALEQEKTYYWRVDETDPPNVHKGQVHSFTTAGAGVGVKGEYFQGMDLKDLKLTRIDPEIDFSWGSGEPDPAVGADNFSVRWTGEVAAQFTETYTFYTMSDDGVRLWVDGKQLINNWTNHGDTEDRGKIDLVAGNTYSIVMELYEDGGGATGQLRFESASTEKQVIPTYLLTPPIKAGNPDPGNGAVDVKQTKILTWVPGEAAASHEVYFDTDADAVQNADTSSPEYKGSRQLGSETLDPGKLEWDTTYFWRVDEIEDGGTMQKGNVWSFTTANFLIVEDMESYNNINEDEEGSNRIYIAWVDGFDNPAINGSTVGHLNPPFAEQTIVHSGFQSMPFAYDNAVGKSEATLTLNYPTDWTEKGVNRLTIWYQGDATNAAETMYVTLNGSATVDNDNPNAAQAATWTEWNIDLQAFVDQNVNLANVNTITLGLRAVTGGSGMLYFDDIRLYTPVP